MSSLDFARTVLLIGDEHDLSRVDFSRVLPPTIVLALALPASTTPGKPLSVKDLTLALGLAQLLVSIHERKQALLVFLEARMSIQAANVTAIVGTKIASQLIALIGGIEALAKVPSGNIMSLGRSVKKDLAGFSLSHVNPNAGFIFECDLVKDTPHMYRRQAQRLISNKVALAARIDSLRQSPDGSYGKQLRTEIIEKLEKLVEPAPMAKVKPIPPPKIESSKKRGGRRARKQKELMGQTQVRKMANRMTFGVAEDEVIYGSSVVGLGELSTSAASGIRKPVADTKLRNYVKKAGEKMLANTEIIVPRTLSGITAPPIPTDPQGKVEIKFNTPAPSKELSKAGSSKSTTSKYFSLDDSFKK